MDFDRITTRFSTHHAGRESNRYICVVHGNHGAFIGTTDLGQLILKAISSPQGTGIGITLGLCVAFIGLAVDQILRTWANERKKALGLE